MTLSATRRTAGRAEEEGPARAGSIQASGDRTGIPKDRICGRLKHSSPLVLSACQTRSSQLTIPEAS